MASSRGKLLAEGGDESGGKGNVGLVFEQKRKAFTEFDNHARPELAREIDLDETDASAGGPARWSGTGFGHPAEHARSAVRW